MQIPNYRTEGKWNMGEKLSDTWMNILLIDQTFFFHFLCSQFELQLKPTTDNAENMKEKRKAISASVVSMQLLFY